MRKMILIFLSLFFIGKPLLADEMILTCSNLQGVYYRDGETGPDGFSGQSFRLMRKPDDRYDLLTDSGASMLKQGGILKHSYSESLDVFTLTMMFYDGEIDNVEVWSFHGEGYVRVVQMKNGIFGKMAMFIGECVG